MQNAWQLQFALQQDYQNFLNTQLNRIKTMNVNNKIKLQMITGLICLLKQKEQNQKVKMKQNVSTSFSQQQSNFTAYEHQVEQLEDRILQKRAIKFQINQEIQNMEEDLFQMEKTVDTKKDYDEFLRRQIESSMKRIQKQEEKHQKQKQKSYVDRSFNAVTGIFKGWLY